MEPLYGQLCRGVSVIVVIRSNGSMWQFLGTVSTTIKAFIPSFYSISHSGVGFGWHGLKVLTCHGSCVNPGVHNGVLPPTNTLLDLLWDLYSI